MESSRDSLSGRTKDRLCMRPGKITGDVFFLVSSTSSTILVSRNHKRGAGEAALLPELWGAHLLSRAPCPLIALSQEGQLTTISPERHCTHSLWTIWHWRHTAAICLIIPLVIMDATETEHLKKNWNGCHWCAKKKHFNNKNLADREGKWYRAIINHSVPAER